MSNAKLRSPSAARMSCRSDSESTALEDAFRCPICPHAVAFPILLKGLLEAMTGGNCMFAAKGDDRYFEW